MKKLLFLFAPLLLNYQLFAQSGNIDIKKLESDVQKTVLQAYQASVRISLYDAVKGEAGGGTFSGVVIDTAGYILSVAHAVKPDALYQISFPNGQKLLARGLGAIPSNDAAMLKITTKGNWPYAPMGWSSLLQKDMPCISISYPYVVAAETPNIRLGYIAEPQTGGGFIRSTCLMEPGDSGGPLFDLKGRVIGLHSKIDMPLDANFEVPVDTYRKFWQALTQPKTYATLPSENPVPAHPDAAGLQALSGIQHLNTALDKSLNRKLDQAIVKLSSPVTGKNMKSNMLGTLVKMDGVLDKKGFKNKSFVITKSSLVSAVATVEVGPNKFVPAKLIYRDAANDLALLQIDEKLKGGIDLNAISERAVQSADLGKLLASPRPAEVPLISVISNTTVSIPKRPGNAFIGLNTRVMGGKVTISNLTPESPAVRASLFKGDTLLSINGKPILTGEDINKEIESYVTSDTVSFQVVRNGSQFERRVAVKIREDPSEAHLAYHFADGRSNRRSDFSNVLIHDGRLKPVECGGPLYGIDGVFYGINIARYSRTASLAIPASVVRKFVKDALENTSGTAVLK